MGLCAWTTTENGAMDFLARSRSLACYLAERGVAEKLNETVANSEQNAFLHQQPSSRVWFCYKEPASHSITELPKDCSVWQRNTTGDLQGCCTHQQEIVELCNFKREAACLHAVPHMETVAPWPSVGKLRSMPLRKPSTVLSVGVLPVLPREHTLFTITKCCMSV